jgi:hypothetical protein
LQRPDAATGLATLDTRVRVRVYRWKRRLADLAQEADRADELAVVAQRHADHVDVDHGAVGAAVTDDRSALNPGLRRDDRR